MTAAQLIGELAILPPDEQAKVIQFARGMDIGRALTPAELSVLAGELACAEDEARQAELSTTIVGGFYGQASDA